MSENALDKIDAGIIKVLQKDGRASHTEISKRLGVSEATIRKRLAKLLDDKVIKVVAVADPFKIGLNVAAIIKILVDIDKVDSVAKELQDMEQIWYVALNTGNSTFEVEAYLPSIEHLDSLLRKKLWKIPGVKQTETSIVLSYLKRDYTWNF